MVESTSGEKRGPGRPPKAAATPAPKKQKLSHPSTKEATPVARESPAAQQTKSSGLPSKISASGPLPVLLQQQAPSLSDSEYQSLASSAVLAASLERSQQAWTRDGIFQRFWKKPDTRQKGPDLVLKSMKDKGRCRLRIEPHIFEVNLWVVQKPRPPPPPKSQVQPAPYRPQQQTQYYQNRPLPPNGQAQPLAPLQSRPHAPQPPPQPAAPAAQDKKASPDPVISMLATRASSDPELKALMKEVATGKATQEQLKVFQKHIDELGAVIQAQKAKEAKEEEKRLARPLTNTMIASMKQEPVPQNTMPQQPIQNPAWQQPLPPPPPVQQYVPPPPPPPSEVVFAFTLAGATEDRFLFPQYSILEPLSAQHVLASFIVTRKGSEAADPTGLQLDPNTEYWQPVTMMVEVAYGREPLLKDVSKWVKPAEEVREEMKKIMQRCTRAPDTFLPLRLPIKGSALVAESETTSKNGTPAPEDKKSTKAKSATAGKRSSLAKGALTGVKENKADEKAASVSAGGTPKPELSAQTNATPDGAQDESTDASKPRRTTRKSVRISEI